MPPKRNVDKDVIMQGHRKTCQEVLKTCYPVAPKMILKSNRPILWDAHGMGSRILRLEVGFLDCCRISTAKSM